MTSNTATSILDIIKLAEDLAPEAVENREGGGVSMFGGQLRGALFFGCGAGSRLARKPGVARFLDRIVPVERADVPG